MAEDNNVPCSREKYHWEVLQDFKNNAKHLIDKGESLHSLKEFLDFELELKKEGR